jgi:hypothetical protein
LIAVIATTSNLEKGGFMIFLVSMFSLRTIAGHRPNWKVVAMLFILLLLVLALSYRFTIGDHVDGAYLLREISGRIFVAQVAGVFMTLSAFPENIPFVGFTGIRLISSIFGFTQSEGSPRLVMSFFWPAEVDLGLLGYMSSYFPAEAYGNFGWPGAIVAPVIVGLSTVLYTAALLQLRNAHLRRAAVVFLLFNLPFTSNYSYFYYSPGLTILTIFLLICDRMSLVRLFIHKSVPSS